jgi:hypothetical protein
LALAAATTNPRAIQQKFTKTLTNFEDRLSGCWIRLNQLYRAKIDGYILGNRKNLESVMKLFAALLLGTLAGIVPALAQTSASTPAGTPAPNKPSVEGSTPTTTTPDPAATVTYRGTGSGYQPMGSGGYNPMGHK